MFVMFRCVVLFDDSVIYLHLCCFHCVISFDIIRIFDYVLCNFVWYIRIIDCVDALIQCINY